jgi:prepilin-type N-terminal cleavage/methylation domain-containing protein
MQRRQQTTGFTLIEMMVTIGIAGVIAMLAGPTFLKMYREVSLSGAMRDLYGGVLEAQGLAKANGKPYCVQFDAALRTWSIRLYNTDANQCSRDFVRKVALAPDHVDFGPQQGYGPPFDVPFENVRHDSWCTPCGDSTAKLGYVVFDIDGSISRSSGQQDFSSGSVVLYDRTQTTSRVEALVMQGLTGALRIFRAN